MPRDPFIDGVPELLILRLLRLHEMYGYELVAEIKSRSQGVFSFGEGSIYPILHRLVTAKQLALRKASVSGRPRRYYTLTKKGTERLAALESQWSNVSNGVKAFAINLSYATT